MKTLLRMTFGLALTALVFAAAVSAPVPQQEGSHKETAKLQFKILGCLDEGDEEGHFVLTDEAGDEVAVRGDSELEKHLGHKVELTGTWGYEGDNKVFKASAIKHISTDC